MQIQLLDADISAQSPEIPIVTSFPASRTGYSIWPSQANIHVPLAFLARNIVGVSAASRSRPTIFEYG
jgi:hypothetical protein